MNPPAVILRRLARSVAHGGPPHTSPLPPRPLPGRPAPPPSIGLPRVLSTGPAAWPPPQPTQHGPARAPGYGRRRAGLQSVARCPAASARQSATLLATSSFRAGRPLTASSVRGLIEPGRTGRTADPPGQSKVAGVPILHDVRFRAGATPDNVSGPSRHNGSGPRKSSCYINNYNWLPRAQATPIELSEGVRACHKKYPRKVGRAWKQNGNYDDDRGP